MSQSKLIKEYLKNKKNYEKLVDVLYTLIKEILIVNKLNYQAIQVRVKDEDSLGKHIVRNKYKGKKISSIHEIPDLAACRVIFYSKKDFEKFKDILQKEFKILGSEDKMLNDGYKGCHFVASLGKSRKKLTEYKELSSLNFEVQITLIFAHGWNEWDHDIFYKDKKEVRVHFPDQFEELRMIAMKISEQLRDAQEAWEDVGRQYEQAAQGKSIFSLITFQELANSDDNNKIYNRLNNLKNFVEEIGELPATLKIDEFTKCLEEIIKKTHANKPVEEKTIYGVWPAKTVDDIVQVILSLSNILAYRGIDFVSSLLLNIYPQQSEETQRKIQEWFKEFAKYKYHTLKKQGYIVQGFFMDIMHKWNLKDRKKYFNIICSLAESIFSPDFEGSTQTDYKTISFHRGGLGDDKFIRKIRNDLIDLLITMYKESDSVEHRLVLLRTLNKAMQVSSYGGRVRDVIKENIKKIVSFYNDIISTADLREIAEMEDSVIWAEKRFASDNIEKIKMFWSKIETMNEYLIYRVFVGYDRNIRLRENISYEESEHRREEKINEFVEGIRKENILEWGQRVISISKELKDANDIGEYSYFGKFLQKVGEKNEVLTFMLLSGNKLEFFHENLIAGLLTNKKKGVIDKTKKFIESKISKGELLYEIARAYWFIDADNTIDLRKIFDKALKKHRQSEIIKTLWQLLLGMKFRKKNKNLILGVIKYFNKVGYYQWTSLYFRSIKNSNDDVFSVLTEKDWDIIIKTLVDIKRIDYHEENMLGNLIQKDPKKFVEIFRRRIAKENTRKSKRDYDAIPYRMHHLTEEGKQILKDNNKEIIDEVLGWLNYDYGWQAGIFLKAVYPHSDSHLEKRINEIIDRGDKKEWEKRVLPFIRWYRNSDMEGYILRTIEKIEKNDSVWGSCMGYLLNPDGSSGNIDDSIIADAYRKKLEMVNAWNFKNRKLNEFKKKCIDYLEKQIKIKDDKHRQQLANMKRKYPAKEEEK